MQGAVVTEQENAMFNLAAVQSVVPLRECKRSQPWPPLFNGFINDALLQLSPDTGKALLQIIDVHCCLIDAFLYQPPVPIVNWSYRSGEFAGQTSGPMKSGVLCRSSLMVSRAWCACALLY